MGGTRRPASAILGAVTTSVRWAVDAEERLRNVPFFIRPFVRRRAEATARERGLPEVTSQLLDEIKGREHTPG